MKAQGISPRPWGLGPGWKKRIGLPPKKGGLLFGFLRRLLGVNRGVVNGLALIVNADHAPLAGVAEVFGKFCTPWSNTVNCIGEISYFRIIRRVCNEIPQIVDANHTPFSGVAEIGREFCLVNPHIIFGICKSSISEKSLF